MVLVTAGELVLLVMFLNGSCGIDDSVLMRLAIMKEFDLVEKLIF